MKKFGSALLLTAGLALLVAACAPAAAPPAPEKKEAAPAAKEKPRYGGSYRFSSTNPRTGQDPHRTSASAHFSNFGHAYDSLLRYKFSPDISESQAIFAPELADRWENPTPTTWVFYLHKGVKWHNVPPVNGREFVADDVVYSVDRMKAGGPQKGYWLDLDKVEALDKYTVKFTLKNPSAPFLAIAAFGFNKMVAKEAVEAGGGNVDKGPLIGTGPWFVECTADIECIYKRNREYYLKDEDGNQIPYMDEMRNIIIADVQARLASFRAKQLDTYGLTAEELGIVQKAHPEVVIRQVKSFGARLVHFRNDRAPWSDERVRMAVSKAIDRQQILDTIAGGKGWFQLGWGAPGEDWYLPQEEYKQAYKRDVPLAKKLLAEAGYANGIDATFWCAIYGTTDVPTCELIVAHLAEIGIRVKIKTHDPVVYNSQVYIRDGQYEDMAGFAQGVHNEPELWLSDYYHSKGGRNSGHINDPKLDQLIEAQRRELVPEKRKQIVLEIQRYILQKNFGLSLYSGISDSANWPWLKNVSYSSANDYPASRQWDYYWVDQELKKKLGAGE